MHYSIYWLLKIYIMLMNTRFAQSEKSFKSLILTLMSPKTLATEISTALWLPHSPSICNETVAEDRYSFFFFLGTRHWLSFFHLVSMCAWSSQTSTIKQGKMHLTEIQGEKNLSKKASTSAWGSHQDQTETRQHIQVIPRKHGQPGRRAKRQRTGEQPQWHRLTEPHRVYSQPHYHCQPTKIWLKFLTCSLV